MKITCALSPSQIEKLYAHVYGHMLDSIKKGVEFDTKTYMTDLFNKIANGKDADTAAKFLQQIPTLIGTASFRPSLEELDIKTDNLRPLIKLFKNEEQGLNNVIKYFNPVVKPAVKAELIAKTEEKAFVIEEKTGDDIVKDPFDYIPYSAISTTFQEFLQVDPNDAEQLETLDSGRKVIYNTLKAIKETINEAPSLKSIVYQKKKLNLKPIRLSDIPAEMLDKSTARLLNRALYLNKTSKALSNVTTPDQLFLMIITDQQGQPIYFSENGDISSMEDGGKLVYQFLREVRKDAKGYRVTDMYGKTDAILNPRTIAEKIAKDAGLSKEAFEELVSDIYKKQQQEFKELYDFKESLLKGEAPLLSITGVSNGVSEFIPETVNLSTLGNIVSDPEYAVSTITTVKSARSQFSKGEAVIQIQDKEYKIDRPNLTDDLINKIASVLVNKNISNLDKYNFVTQFLADKASNATRKHSLTYLENTDTLVFSYSPTTYQEGYASNFVPVNLESSTAQDEIYNALKKASGKDGKYFSAKMTYNAKLLKDMQYQDYSLDSNTIDDFFSSYNTLLSTLPNTKIFMNIEAKGRTFNSYMSFALPNEVVKQLSEAEKDTTEIVRDDFFENTDPIEEQPPVLGVLETKEKIVDLLKEGYKLKGLISKPINSRTRWELRTKKGNIVEFYNKENNITEEDLTKEATLHLVPNITDENGIVFVDPVQVRIGDKNIGYVRVTRDFNAKAVVEKSIEEIESEINNIIAPEDTKSPEDDGAGDVFFYRSENLPSDVTKEQIDEAKKWWNNSPLKKYIGLKEVANVVNSNAYARFIKHGSVLNGNLGTIEIANKGSMVDVYHEAWHGFTQLFLTKADKKALYKEVRRKLGGRKSFFEIEEILAEDFRTYAKNPKAKKDSPERNSIFRKILNFLREFLGLGSVTDVMEIKSVVEMFDKLYLGKELNNYTPLVDNVMFDVLERNSGIVQPGTQDVQVLNRQDSNLLKESMDSIISEVVDEQNNLSNDKSKSLSILLDSRNRDPLYKLLKVKLTAKLNAFKTSLDNLEDTDENEIKKDLLENRIRILQTGLDNYGDTKTGTVAYHVLNSSFDLIRQKYITLELDEEGKLYDPNQSERFGDKKIGDQSLVELAGKETLYLLKSLHAKNDKGQFEYNELGFKKLADFRNTWNNTVRTLSGLQDPKEMYNAIIEESVAVPVFKQLLEKLPNPNTSNNLYEFKITTSFWQDFNKPRVPYIQLTIYGTPKMSTLTDKNGELIPMTTEDDRPIYDFTVAVTNASIDTSNALKTFQDKFKGSLTNSFVDRIGRDNIPYLNLKKVVNTFQNEKGTLDESKSFDFANAIGISLDDNPIIKSVLKKDTKAIEKFGLPYLFDAIKIMQEKENLATTNSATRNAINDFKMDPIGMFVKGIPEGVAGKGVINQKTQLNNLAELQVRYGSEGSNFGVFNAERNLVFEHIDNHSISKQVYGLNAAKKLSDLWEDSSLAYMGYLDPAINSYTNKLGVIRSLFDVNSSLQLKRKNRSLKLFMDSGTQYDKNISADGVNTTSLDVNSKMLQEINTMLKGGVQEFMRHASKSSSFGAYVEGGVIAQPGKKGDDNYLWVDIDMFDKKTASDYAMKAHIIPYMEGEAGRIFKFRQNKEEFKKYVGYNRKLANGQMAGEVFTVFDDVLSSTVKEEIYAAIDKAIEEKTNFDLKTFLSTNPKGIMGRIKTDIKEYFNYQSKANYVLFEESKYLDPELLARFKKSGKTDEEIEKTLIEAYTYNAWIHNFEMGILFYGDFIQYNHEKEEMHKRNTGSTSGGPGYRTDKDAQRFVNDYVANTSYAASLKNKDIKPISYNGTYTTAILQDIERNSVYLKQIEKGLRADYEKRYAGTKVSKEEIDRRIGKEVKKYTGMEEGDGQGFITFDGYRTLNILQNSWSNAQEVLFQKIVEGIEVSVGDVTEMFPVLKAQNFGPLATKIGDTRILGLPINAMHKFALAPLIPSVIRDSDLQSLHEQMMKKGVQYATFQTGSKVGSVTSNGKADKIYDDSEQKSLKKDIEFTPNIIHLEYLKNVTSVPNKYKGKTVFATQLRKLILGDMYRNGKIINSKNEPAVKRYETAVKGYSNILKLELLNEIGYEYNPETKKYSGNLDDFLNVVQAELERKDLPEHLIQLVGLNRDKSIKTDLSLHLKADEIEKILVALVEKRLIKQKVKGESLVQVSSTMSNGLWDRKLKNSTEEDVRKYMGTNNLPFYNNETADGKTSAMKIAIALQGDFYNLLKLIHNDGEVIGTRERLNDMIKDDVWLDKSNNRKSVTLSAVRIPVQGLNSMEFMEVYEFLDPAAGNIIIPPTEIVAKSGGDFDVDKLTTFMPTIDSTGRFVESGMSNQAVANKVKELNQTPEGRKTGINIIKTQKAALENELIQSIKGILELPNNYANLVRPNDTYLLKDDLSDKLQDDVIEYNRFANVHDKNYKTGVKGQKVISPTRILEVAYNLHKHDVNMVGKNVLGMLAVENSLHPVFNSVGASLPKTYKASTFDDQLNRYVDTNEDYDTRLFLPHNKTEEEAISLAGTDDVFGVDKIADLYSQFMNGAVDVEKDAWISFIQGNYETVPMITFLLKAGVPKEYAIAFVSNPLVRDYTKEQRLIGSAYAKLTGKIPQDFKETAAKWQAAENTLSKYDLKKGKKSMVSNAGYYNAVTTNVVNSGILEKDGTFSLDKMMAIIKDKTLSDPENKEYAKGMFLHFIELEKMSKGFTTLKMQSNPDTKTSKTLQEIINRNLSLEETKEMSKLPKGLVDDVMKSILGPFFNNQLVSDMIVPLFPLRNNNIVTNYIINNLSTRQQSISAKFGSGQDGVRQFINQFKNAIPNYIFQNYMSNMLDENGQITSMPSEYKEMKVIEKSGVKNGVEVIDNTIYIDKARLEKEYAEELYLRDDVSSEGYKQQGLQGFRREDALFPNESMYVKYAIEREYQRSLYPLDTLQTNKDYLKFKKLTEKYVKDPQEASRIAYERYLNQRALINSFNREAVMGLPNNSYTDLVLDMIAEFPNLKSKYPILAQLTKPKVKSGESVLTLNDIKMLKDSQLVEIYYNNIKELADIDVIKTTNKEDNKRISKLFSLLPNMIIYQHGMGYSKYGFTEALPYEDYIGVMQSAADIFLTKNLNEATLDLIYQKMMASKSSFKNYVSEPKVYRSGLSKAQAEELVPEILAADSPEILDLLSRVPGAQTEEIIKLKTPEIEELTQEEADWLMDNLKVITQKYNSSTLAGSKDIELKEPIVIGDTTVTHIDPEAGGKPSFIFERPSGRYMVKLETNQDKVFPRLYIWKDANVKGEFSFYQSNDSSANDIANLEKAGLNPLIKELYLDTNIPDPGTRLGQFQISNTLQQKYGLKRTYKDIVNTFKPEMKREEPIQPEVSDENAPEGLPGIPRSSSSCK
jgi:hypothetical protein